MTRRVNHRFAGGGNEGTELLVQLCVTNDNRLDADLVRLLHPSGRDIDGGIERNRIERPAPSEEPCSELTFLNSRERCDLARGFAALDQSEGLEHRIVQVRGHLSTFLGTHTFATLVGHLLGETKYPRTKDQNQSSDGDRHREHKIENGL